MVFRWRDLHLPRRNRRRPEPDLQRPGEHHGVEPGRTRSHCHHPLGPFDPAKLVGSRAPPGTTYCVYRSQYAGGGAYGNTIAEHVVGGTSYLDGPSSDYIDPGLQPGTQYFYAVRAILPADGNGYEAWTNPSNEASATTASESVTVWPLDFYTVPGVAFSGVVGMFDDSTRGTTAADYSASVTWADGSATPAAIVPDGHGAFNVQVTHTFANEPDGGKYVLRVTDSTGAPVGPVGGEAHLGSVDGLTLYSTTPYDTQGFHFTATVVQFTDGTAPGQPGDYSVVISWGDGSVSAGTVFQTGQDGLFSVVGDHTYLLPHYQPAAIRVGISRTTNPSDAARISTLMGLTDTGVGSGTVLTVIAGQAFTALVGGFRNAPTYEGPVTDYTATITWADGTTTPATVVADPVNDLPDPDNAWIGYAYAVYADIDPKQSESFTIEIDDAPRVSRRSRAAN